MYKVLNAIGICGCVVAAIISAVCLFTVGAGL